MKRKIMKTLAIGVAIVMMVSSLAGCGKSADSNASLTGKISIAGSTSMEKLCEALWKHILTLPSLWNTPVQAQVLSL